MYTLGRILLVEDDPRDVELTLTALEDHKLANEVTVAHDGQEALDYLYRRGQFATRPNDNPAVMLLDLNMPMQNGFDVLAWVRSQPGLKRLAVIILTSSIRSEDVERAFDLGANSFLVKPSTLEALTAMMRCLCEWISISHFPPLTKPPRK